MKCYANRVTTRLLGVPVGAPVTATVNGASQRILPEQSDRQTDAVQEFKFITSMTFTGGLTSPTAQIIIQGSLDGVAWIDLLLGTVRTDPGTYAEALDSATVGLLPWVRARLVLAGGTAPSVVANVDVVSTGPFTLSSS